MRSALPLCCAGVALILQGCGGGGEGPATSSGTTTTTAAPTGNTTTTRTTTTPTPKPRPPASPAAKAIAELLNQQFHSFNPDDPTSGKGVYLRQSEEWKVYCHTPCFSGTPDCRISGSIFNDKQMLTRGSSIAWDFGKKVAWYVNQSLIETVLGKCSFVWDGGTMGKFNMGCGCNYGHTGCDDHKSAYYNLDPDTNYQKTNTGTSKAVASCACENQDQSKWPTKWGNAPNCFWKGPAYYPPDGWSKDDTWTMLKWRVDHQDYAKQDGPKDPRAFWNEMVVDGEQLLKQLGIDAAATIPAFVYDKSKADARETAENMANQMASQYGLQTRVPVIAVDTGMDVVNGGNPFSAEDGSPEEIVV